MDKNNKIIALAKTLLSSPPTEDGSMIVNTDAGCKRSWTCRHCGTEIIEYLSSLTLVDDGECSPELGQHPDSCEWKQFMELANETP